MMVPERFKQAIGWSFSPADPSSFDTFRSLALFLETPFRKGARKYPDRMIDEPRNYPQPHTAVWKNGVPRSGTADSAIDSLPRTTIALTWQSSQGGVHPTRKHTFGTIHGRQIHPPGPRRDHLQS